MTDALYVRLLATQDRIDKAAVTRACRDVRALINENKDAQRQARRQARLFAIRTALRRTAERKE